MPMLLADLAADTLAGNRRTADRLETEVRAVQNLERDVVKLQRSIADSAQETDGTQRVQALAEVRQTISESARQATQYALARLPQAEVAWNLALETLRRKPAGDEAEQLLRTFLDIFESEQRLIHSPQALWEIARQAGVDPEQLDELNRADQRLQELAGEAKSALEHRACCWHPADPERLALGLQQAREGRTVSAEQARARFRSVRT